MFPLKDDNPAHRIPLLTIVLIITNCLIHFYQMTLPHRETQMFVFQFGLIPMEIVQMRDLTPEIPFPIWLSPFSAMFLHGDLLHLGSNMLYLWIFGNNVEDTLGPFRFIVFYLVSGLAAAALFVLFNPNGTVPLVGASGAIAGVLGGYMVAFPKARILTLVWVVFFVRMVYLPAVVILGYWILIQILMALSSLGAQEGSGVAWLAHVGGFAFGWLYFRGRLRRKTVAVENNDPF